MIEKTRATKIKKEGQFREEILDIRRVTRVVAGGKRFRFRATVAIGDLVGKVGIGVAKGVDVAMATEKAKRVAQNNLISVPIVNGTIAHEVKVKCGAAKVLIKPASPGHGLVAGGIARIILRLAGISNASAKFLSPSSNKLNNARVVIEALKSLKRRDLPQKSNADSRITT